MGYNWCQADRGVEVKNERPVKIEQFRYRELEIATGSFGGESLLGKGSHGCVYKGVLEGGKLVAVKRISSGLLELKDERAFVNEIEILSNLHSPRLVNLVGISHDSEEILMVVEFMANGTLHDVLNKNGKPPSWPRRIHIALQTAKAIQALHNAYPPVIHRDIKSSNVLIDQNWNAKLGDFGLALRGHLKDIQLNSTPPAGTMGYLDPSYISPANLSTKTDVFSFGILLLEIISSRNAIDVNYDPPSIVDWALPLIEQDQVLQLCDPRLRQPKSLSGIKRIAHIAASCIRADNEKRPSMNQVVDELKLVSRSFPLPLWNGLTSRMRQRSRQGKPHLTKGNTKEPSKRRFSRTTGFRLKPVTEECTTSSEPGIAMRCKHSRNLMDLFNETKECSKTKSVDWQVLAKSSHTFISLPGIIQTRELFLRSSSLSSFHDQGKNSFEDIRRAISLNDAKKHIKVNPALHLKQAPQATVSV
ncbi:hypothetical protein SUGI_1169270 [Cryptomeria japonica]|nr:hypothetical protein SUGI_1169270 [Cryptomeria japonica]